MVLFFTPKNSIVSPFNIIVILGPTASGKTELACQLAKQIGGEIISADSRQVYREMDIGTGKDLEEYVIDGVEIETHLIDIKDPGYKYNIAEFQHDFIAANNQIQAKGKMPILCGGSGLYIETALRGNNYLGIPSDEEVWQKHKKMTAPQLDHAYELLPTEIKTSLNALTPQRKIRAIEISQFLKNNPNWTPVKVPELNPLIIGVNIDREERRAKITRRLSQRMNNGLIEEVERLLNGKLSHEDLAYYGLEYKWIGQYLKREISKRVLFESLNIAIHQFAKRQMTWFRRMEKNGYEINWVDANLPMTHKLDTILNGLNDAGFDN